MQKEHRSRKINVPTLCRAAAISICAAVPLTQAVLAQSQEGGNYLFDLQPMPSSDLPVSPFLEGWYDNGDGTYTLSFGYFNRNAEEVVHIPHGPDNAIDNADVQGKQPTVFLPGRHHGVFGITIQEADREQDLVWSIANADGIHSVPGRARIGAYELDWAPRAHGAMPPLMWFDNTEDTARRGPGGIEASQTLAGTVGESLTLAVNVRDDSKILNVNMDDPNDRRRYTEPTVRVVWSAFQGDPGGYEFIPHESSPRSTSDSRTDSATVVLSEGHGTAQVDVRFSSPGEYVFRARSDNFARGDSRPTNQCCWSNSYQRVIVTE